MKFGSIALEYDKYYTISTLTNSGKRVRRCKTCNKFFKVPGSGFLSAYCYVGRPDFACPHCKTVFKGIKVY